MALCSAILPDAHSERFTQALLVRKAKLDESEGQQALGVVPTSEETVFILKAAHTHRSPPKAEVRMGDHTLRLGKAVLVVRFAHDR